MDMAKHIEMLDKQRLNNPVRFYAVLVSMQIDGQLRELHDGRYLLTHAMEHRRDELALHLVAGSPLGDPDNTGHYFVHCAVDNRCKLTLKALVDSGLSIETVSWSNETPMMIAVRKDDIGMLDVIRDIDPDCCMGRAYEDDNLIHYAAVHGAIGAIDWLIDGGVDVNEANYLGRTPIFNARTPEVIDTLGRLGADFSVIDNQGLSIEEAMRSSVYRESIVDYVDVARSQQMKRRIQAQIHEERTDIPQLKKRKM